MNTLSQNQTKIYLVVGVLMEWGNNMRERERESECLEASGSGEDNFQAET